MHRVPHKLRRPGARHSFDCDEYDEDFDHYRPVFVEDSRLDRYLASKFPDARRFTRVQLMKDFHDLIELQNGMLFAASCIAVDGTYFHAPCRPAWLTWRWPSRRTSKLCMDIREPRAYVVAEWDVYAHRRMDFIRAWFHCDYPQMPTPEQQRQFEKEAWYWDKGHKRVLAARRRMARIVVFRLLRKAVKQCAIALYWQERTQRALCAPGGAGRVADRDAFESEFA